MSEIYKKYFPDLDEDRLRKLELFKEVCLEWNEKINVISRKDTDEFEINHVLHSLAIAKVFPFKKGSKILDFGTGGGFPGLPLAIFLPDVQFTLVDSIGKKMKVVDACVQRLGLKNVETRVGRVEDIDKFFDFITCRAVGRVEKIVPWVRKKLIKNGNNAFPNGFIFLKGGDVAEELSQIEIPYKRIRISDYFEEPFFETKEIVYLSKHHN